MPKKLDYLYNEIVRPGFAAILKKHELTTDLDLDNPLPSPAHQPVFNNSEVVAYAMMDSSEEFKVQPNEEVTNIFGPLIYEVFKTVTMPENHFQMGRYSLSMNTTMPINPHCDDWVFIPGDDDKTT